MAMTNTTKKKKSRFVLSGILICLICLIGILFFAKKEEKPEIVDEIVNDYRTVDVDGVEYEFNTSIVSILGLGIDTTNPQQVQGQADVIQLLLLNRETKQIDIVVIPRDTMTEIRLFDVAGNELGWERQHLNLAYAYGSNPKSGCMYTMQAVSRMMSEIPIVYYMAMNLNELENIHRLVGTLEVVVPNDSLVEENPEWKKGSIVSITEDNVELLRKRDIDKDFSNVSRMERQNAYLEAYFNKIKSDLENDFDNTFSSMYNLFNDLITNLSHSDIEDFANMILEYEFDPDKNVHMLEGENVSGYIHDEYEIDQEKLKTLIIELFYKQGGGN